MIRVRGGQGRGGGGVLSSEVVWSRPWTEEIRLAKSALFLAMSSLKHWRTRVLVGTAEAAAEENGEDIDLGRVETDMLSVGGS